MDLQSNTTAINLDFEHNVAFGLTVTVLALIIICILYIIYKIAAGAENIMEMELNQINEQRLMAPPNTAND